MSVIVTSINTNHPVDKFGLRHQPDATPSYSPLVLGNWLPIRDLQARHRHRIVDHLLQLNEHDRYLRFGFHAPKEQIERYVASTDFKRDEVFGIFDQQLQLVAVAHLAAMPGYGPHGQSSRDRAMEFGVSVLPEGRGQGLGMRLFQHAIMHARNRGASHLMIQTLSENAPMLSIARKAGAKVEREGPEAQAWLALPPDTMASHFDSSMHSIAAEMVYRMKYQTLHAADWLRMLVTTV